MRLGWAIPLANVTRHRPATHLALEGEMAEQTFPQAPQLPLSVCVSRQTELHEVFPVGQLEAAQTGALPLHTPLAWQPRTALPTRL
jgi:hypothetical protein